MATSVPPRTESASSISSGRLSREDRADEHVFAVGQARQEVADAGEVVRAVPDLERLLAAALEPSGQRHVVSRMRVDGTPEERLGRRERRARGCCCPHERRLRAPFARADSSHSGSPSTTTRPAGTTASFSAAIASRVSPSTSMWSSATFVSTTTRVRRTFVASWRPPSPASTTATSTSASANASSAAAVSALELRRAELDGLRLHARDRALEVRLRRRRSGSARSSRARAARGTRRREAPRRRAAPRSSASSSTCRSCRRRAPPGSAAAGRRARPSSARIRSSPKPSAGHGLSDGDPVSCGSRQARAGSARASRARPRRRRPARCAVNDSFESISSARAISFSSRAISSSSFAPSSASRAPAARPPRRSAARHLRAASSDAAAPEPLGRLLHADERVRVGRVRRVRLRPRRDDQPRRARGQMRPDLLGHVRHHRMQQLEQPLERGECRRLHVRLAASRGLIDSRYQSQKSSKVRW